MNAESSRLLTTCMELSATAGQAKAQTMRLELRVSSAEECSAISVKRRGYTQFEGALGNLDREWMGAGVPHGLQNRCAFEKGAGGFDSYTFPPLPHRPDYEGSNRDFWFNISIFIEIYGIVFSWINFKWRECSRRLAIRPGFECFSS